MGICIAQTMPKAGIWAIYSWKPQFRKPIRWAMFVNYTEDFFFPKMKRTKTSLTADPNYVPVRIQGTFNSNPGAIYRTE